MDPIRIATWNVKWGSKRGKHFKNQVNRIEETRADILVLTETTHDLIPEGGFFAKGGPDWGYESSAGRRKVLLWSRWPISDVSNEISEPGGRHVSTTVDSPLGPVRVHAVCVPWSHAHVSGGHENREVWQDHLRFLTELRDLLKVEADDPRTRDLPLVVAGDINQRDQPRPYGNVKVRKYWAETLAEGDLVIVTDEAMIDKIAISPGLTASDSRVFGSEPLSDHHAVSCLIRLSDAGQP